MKSRHIQAIPPVHHTRIPGLVREHQGWRSSDDIGNSGSANGGMLKTRKIPRTISVLLLVELSIQRVSYSIFATSVHARSKPWRSRTNPDTRVQYLAGQKRNLLRLGLRKITGIAPVS